MNFDAIATIARQAIAASIRDRIIVLMAGLFLVLVLISAYLGWSASTTVNAIYLSAAEALSASGQVIPPNPIRDDSSLALLRNMATYVSLIGALTAIVVGYQLIAGDRKAGVLPLLGSRPLRGIDIGLGKTMALAIAIVGITVFAALINTIAFLMLPELQLEAFGWGKLMGFYAVSTLYLLAFGWLGLACGATARSESVGLLLPVTIWLTFTFILPQLTSDINPVAALNPVSAMADPPVEPFFMLTGWMLGPFSLAEAYRVLGAQLLDFMPSTYVVRSAIAPLATLLLATAAAGGLAVACVARTDLSRGEFDA